MHDNQPVKLEVVYEKYSRYKSEGGFKKATIQRDTYLEALKSLVNNLNIYLTAEDIEDEQMTCDDVIRSIEFSNGDGCDYIILLKDLISGETIIESDSYEDEEW